MCVCVCVCVCVFYIKTKENIHFLGIVINLFQAPTNSYIYL